MAVKRMSAWMEMISNDVEVKRLLSERWIVCRHTCAWKPPMDVYEDDDVVVVRIEVAGMSSEDFSISLAGRVLVVSATRVDPESKRMYHQMEIHFGEFRAEIYLPWVVEPDDVEASYEEGFLKVCLPSPGLQRVPVVKVEQAEG